MTLKEIALELLEKYQTSETSCIWELSGNIAESEKWLSAEVQKYRELIEASAGVVERKKGEWIDENCSVCGQYVYHGDAGNFCPECGADMRGGKDE